MARVRGVPCRAVSWTAHAHAHAHAHVHTCIPISEQVSQTFRARLFLILRVAGGADDEHLVKEPYPNPCPNFNPNPNPNPSPSPGPSPNPNPNPNQEYDGFPLDTNGVPTFRPSARWYLVRRPAARTTDRSALRTASSTSLSPHPHSVQNQISFSNGRSVETQESKVTAADTTALSLSGSPRPEPKAEPQVTVAGNDLQLIKRVEGDFFSRFELHGFPFDAQVAMPEALAMPPYFISLAY